MKIVKKRHRISLKIIFCSTLLSLLLLMLFAGLVVAEKNTRKIGFDDNTPWFIYADSPADGHYLGFRFMGQIYKLDFSGIYDASSFLTEKFSALINNENNV